MTLHLRIRPVAFATAFLLAVPATALAAGQGYGNQGKNEHQQEQHSGHAMGKPHQAMSSGTEEVSLPVSGLTKDDAGKVQTELKGIEHRVWVCPSCSRTSDEKGTCPMCHKDMVEQSKPVLDRVATNPSNDTIDITLQKGMDVRLSEVERALAVSQVKVDPQKVELSGNTELYVSGPTTQEAASKLQQALNESKLFSEVNVEHKTDSREYQIVAKAPAAKAPSHAEVAKVIERAGDGFRLTNVAWTTPKRMG